MITFRFSRRRRTKVFVHLFQKVVGYRGNAPVILYIRLFKTLETVKLFRCCRTLVRGHTACATQARANRINKFCLSSRRRRTKVLLNFFQKIAVSKGRAFGRSSQRAKNLYSWSAFLKVWKRSFARLPKAILPDPLWAKRANSWLKTCFQSPFLQEKKFSQVSVFAQTNLKNYPVDDFWR